MSLPPERADKPTVLVVDDTPDNLTLLSGVLKDAYKVKVATSGERALEMLKAGPPPAIMLLDVMMPGMDGYEVMRRMRERPELAEIPVIFVTGKSAAEDEEQGFALGAVDYIVKPISPPTVLARVRTHLALSERTAMLRSLSEKLSHYLAPQVYRSIFEGRHDASIRTHRKKLTIFFSDIKDFTQASQDLAPEDLTALLNEYFTEMSRIALEYGATIDKFIGDAMLMFFGDPESKGLHEDARQCVRMAVAMQRRMVELQGLWRDRGYLEPFRMRIGINTGYCNVGNFGSEQRMDYTIIGAEVNLAARLEQIADPDGIVLSYETYALVRDEFEADERPPVHVKGIPGEIRCVGLRNVLGDGSDRSSYVVRERDGMRLSVDVAKLGQAGREAAIADLEDVLARLRAVH